MGSQMVRGGGGWRGGAGGVFLDKTNSTITIEDSDFGFVKNELVTKSGTKAFLVALSAGGDGWAVRCWLLIGLFGFGQGSC